MEPAARQAPGPPPRPARAIADRLHSAAIHLLRRLRVEDKALGLSGPRASALSVIVFRGPLTMSALAEAEQVRRPTITRLIDGLERRGLVRRVSDPADGRVQLVEATAAGKKFNLPLAYNAKADKQSKAEMAKFFAEIFGRK